MPIGCYTLDDAGQPVPCEDVRAWGGWYEENSALRHVGDDYVGEVHISTVFLGLDHGFGEGPAVLWETMIFGGPHHHWMDRYSSRADALAGHQRVLAALKEGRDP